MRARRPDAGGSGIRSEINVTPLVDVCLVLLIIFMVVTPMLQEGADVPLPETATPAPMPESTDQLDVVVRRDGSLLVENDWIPDDRLTGALDGIRRRDPARQVVLRADRELPYRRVREILVALEEAGFHDVGLVTRKHEVRTGP